MASKCTGAVCCSSPVPAELQDQALCVLHYLRKVEETCNDLRRETVLGMSGERAGQVHRCIAEFGEHLIHISLNGDRLSDDLKMGVLNGVLALINVRESMERASAATREAAFRRANGRGR